jgi:hypothetical protein
VIPLAATFTAPVSIADESQRKKDKSTAEDNVLNVGFSLLPSALAADIKASTPFSGLQPLSSERSVIP